MPVDKGPNAEMAPKFTVTADVPVAPSVAPAASVSKTSAIPLRLFSVALMVPVAVGFWAKSDAPARGSITRAAQMIVL